MKIKITLSLATMLSLASAAKSYAQDAGADNGGPQVCPLDPPPDDPGIPKHCAVPVFCATDADCNLLGNQDCYFACVNRSCVEVAECPGRNVRVNIALTTNTFAPCSWSGTLEEKRLSSYLKVWITYEDCSGGVHTQEFTDTNTCIIPELSGGGYSERHDYWIPGAKKILSISAKTQVNIQMWYGVHGRVERVFYADKTVYCTDQLTLELEEIHFKCIDGDSALTTCFGLFPTWEEYGVKPPKGWFDQR